jgi:type II secretory pathway pseudopilin PulG
MTAPRSPHAFSLVELLVIIGVVVIVVGITLPFLAGTLDRGRTGQARAMLNGLAGALDEYEMRTGAVPTVSHNENLGPLGTVVVGGDDDNTIGYFLHRTRNIPEVLNLIRASAGPRNVFVIPEDFDPVPSPITINDMKVLDPWGNKIRYVHRVTRADKGNANAAHLPVHPNPFFASAGPDGRWGAVAVDGTRDADAADNIYSFEAD